MKMAFSPTRKTLKSEAALAAVMAATMAFACGPAQAQTFPPENPPCPTSRLTQQQGGLAPFPEHCPANSNCLVTFKGYQWWTSYQVPFFNGGLKSPFAPEHAFIGEDKNLHVMANNDIDLGVGKVWSGAEAVLMFNSDGSEANLGYGDYLVTARLVGRHWAGLDPNMAFGLFLYENPPTGGPGTSLNPNREMDLAELSRWGWNHTGTCPIGVPPNDPLNGNFPNKTLCNGDAQFALQLIGNGNETQGPLMVDRYDIGQNDEVTLVMRWREKKVTFEKYNGTHSLNNLNQPPNNPWGADPNIVPTPPIFKTEPRATLNSLGEFVPQHTANSCERFHINFWFGNYSAGQNANPPPRSPQEVIITNFEFRP
jgi:hypothetical protein